MDATKSRRPAMAAVGCAIILATGIGSTSVLNAITPLLIEGMGTTVIITIPTMKKLEMNPELSNTTQIPAATAQVQVVERKQD